MTYLRKGAAHIAILSVLAEAPQYAYRIIPLLEARSEGFFEFRQGLIYPALHKLEREGLIAGDWRQEEGRRRKYYRLTDEGRQRLAQEERELRSYARALLRLLEGGA
ncbi:MAG: helix-turn-helix transcriptional regulator [Caldilineales bacterium]|nr:helix-turn-helix transcriptional regulator [Caldilineales bacterium]